MFIVLLETSGNQRYIFSTNKLRENVGASELTYQIGTETIRNAVKTITNRTVPYNLIDEPSIETLTDEDVEVIIATSGKALLLAKDKKVAEKIVSEVTKTALLEMSGLTINGAICEVTDATDAKSLHKAVGDVHKRLEEIRYQIPSNLQRFQRIPFVAECNTSNLPAEKLYRHKVVETVEDEKPHSLVSITKQESLFEGKKRLEQTIKNIEPSLFLDFAKNPHDLDRRFKNTNWFAVIHADGNGLGQKFLNFREVTDSVTLRDYVDNYRKFSLALDECTVKATAFALKNMRTEYLKNHKDIDLDKFEVPAIPLVLGGDDLTIICDGQYAIKFTKDFLTEFVKETKKPEIQGIFPKGVDLGICAGIAIIKPHFPFHQAYSLAAELIKSTKNKTKVISPSLSAFDYHVLYDSSGTTLEEIREKTPFVARPYVVTPKETAKKYTTKATEQTWIENHHFDQLEKRVEAMIEPEEGEEKRKLPNSQMHVLREGLFVADKTADIQKEVDARAKLIAHRYPSFKDLFVKDKTLFFDEEGEQLTHFLDALDIVEFWK